MNFPTRSDYPSDATAPARLEAHYTQVEAIILARQDPITGLLPASTAITVHGDYTHAWVRDNVYSILAVWGLALAYRRQGHQPGRTYRLEQSVVKLMRGLLVAMMKQAAKVERFKHLPDPLHALHAKYDTRTGEPVVGDDQWGHLQLDATALFLLMLAQMTASGLRIVFIPEEVALVQNLVHYLSRAYVTPDFGIWERGHKMNEGQAELNASSLGMVKAALEALRGFNVYGEAGGPDSVIQVVADDIARARSTLEALLPRESHSKEIDAALLSVIGYPAFALEDDELADRTRAEIVTKLQGRYGCKRFLRDGHQTVLEDHDRLHYQAGELKAFEHIESEWPLFFTYLLLDHSLRGDEAGARDYRRRLEGLMVERDGQRLLPELYYVPFDAVAPEKADPGSQARLPNDNVPLVWAQSLFMLGTLLQEGLIEAEDIDPLGRRLRLGRTRDIRVGIALLAENAQVQAALARQGVPTELIGENPSVQVLGAEALAAALEELGRESRLGLSGRPRQRLDTLATCQVYSRGGRPLVFLPAFLSPDGLFLNRDNRLLVQRLGAELNYIRRHWDQPGQPLLTLMVSAAMLEAGGHEELLALLDELRAGSYQGVAVRLAPLTRHLSLCQCAGPALLSDTIPDPAPVTAVTPPALSWQRELARPLPHPWSARWHQEADTGVLLAELAREVNPYAQVELLGLLWERGGPDLATDRGSVRESLEELYRQAGQAQCWGVVRRALPWLPTAADALEEAVVRIVTRRHSIALGRAYSQEAVLEQPLEGHEILTLIRDYGGDDRRAQGLIQELVIYLGMLVRARPERLAGSLTLRPWHLLRLLIGLLARERGLTPPQAFEALLELPPHDLHGRLQRLIDHTREARHNLLALESLPHRGEAPLQRVRFAPDPEADLRDWRSWREGNGVLSRLPEDFHARVWSLLNHCRGLVIGDQLDARNRLDSTAWLADTTPGELGFAWQVEQRLDQIQAPEYRQLTTEALLALTAILEPNPGLQIEGDLVLDVLLGAAVQRHWQAGGGQGDYQEQGARAWMTFYSLPPHRVAEAVQEALVSLLTLTGSSQGQPAAGF